MSTKGTAEPDATGSETVATLTQDGLAEMIGQGKFTAATEPETEEEEVEQSPATPEVTAEEPEPEEPETDEIDAFLSQLDDERKMDLASKLGGRLGDELGKMRAENRQLREGLEEEKKKKEPFGRDEAKGDNPYAKEVDQEKLKETYDAAAAAIRDGEKALRRHRNADPDDEILEIGDRNLTYAEVEEMVENAKKARDEYIPERVDQLRKTEGLEAARIQNFSFVKEIHPWLAEEGNELRSAYESIHAKYLGPVRDHLPDILPYFDQMLADHFAAAKARVDGMKNPAKGETKPQKPKPKPPGNPGGSAAASARPVPSSEKRGKILEDFTRTGRTMSEGDLVQFLATK